MGSKNYAASAPSRKLKENLHSRRLKQLRKLVKNTEIVSNFRSCSGTPLGEDE
jgi:hypothetical protein